MKKNKALRLSAVLLVVTLLTTCAISGTFAKYTTQASATDTARVAKFGIVVEATTDTFDETYTGTGSYSSVNTVASQSEFEVSGISTANLVAPGTKNVGSSTFSIKGKAETAVKVVITLGEPKDVFLKEGTYLDWTTGNDNDDTFNLAADYYPVKFTLKQEFGANSWPIATKSDSTKKISVYASNGDATYTEVTAANEEAFKKSGFANGGYVEIKDTTLASINAILGELTNNMTQVNPGYTFNDTFTLTWAWDFDNNGACTNDQADTLLGNLAADAVDCTTIFQKSKVVDSVATAMVADDDYCLAESYNFSITVTQVD